MKTAKKLYYVILAGFIVYFIICYKNTYLKNCLLEEDLLTSSGILFLCPIVCNRLLASNRFKLFVFLKRIISLSILFLMLSFTSSEYDKPITDTVWFDVIKNGRVLGYVKMEKINNETMTKYLIDSRITTRFLLNFDVESKETYIYRGDTLVYSYMYRKINNKEKLNQKILLDKGRYYLTNRKKQKQLLNTTYISCNLVKLFFDEPIGVDKVYSDKLRVFVDLSQESKNCYKVQFPNKSYTLFYYDNKKCIAIEAIGTFYHVKLIPNFTIVN